MAQFYSTNNTQHIVSLRQAVFKGLAPDNGLYMPTEFKKLPANVLQSLHTLSLQELAYEISLLYSADELSKSQISQVVDDAINFEVPIIEIENNISVLELFHGPTCAFKDFGGRFMSRLMKQFLQQQDKELTILVATSGDTGSAVASGFYDLAGIKVIILYPSKKVSHIQEQQLTTLGKNIIALEINGNFDDCQRLVKAAFVDNDIQKHLNTTSANSINIARLIPQSFYYAYASAQFSNSTRSNIFSVPSGNYGNLTAGLFAKKAGIPIGGFIAASNANDIVPHYLQTGKFEPKQTISTISNAMDVGNPSNFVRMQTLYNSNLVAMQADIFACAFNDDTTKKAMINVYEKSNYILDPHGAVSYLGCKAFHKKHSTEANFIVLETAHPAKFGDIVKDVLQIESKIPQQLQACLNEPKQSILMSKEFADFKAYLLQR